MFEPVPFTNPLIEMMFPESNAPSDIGSEMLMDGIVLSTFITRINEAVNPAESVTFTNIDKLPSGIYE